MEYSGSGNWYAPKQLEAEGKFVMGNVNRRASRVPKERIGGLDDGAMESRRVGRGGAGNFIWEAEMEKRALAEKEKKVEEIHMDILKGVEAGLAKPGKAFLKAEIVKE
ncbi:hypothetical protein BT63DRAFT_425910 [Microthyrium microscopicum]|uniref:Uncharacterized protein n=1 Tax=Microthyrium microscopicum TaxID=703497 RepID=A0A6A6UCG0_9PEZI|nr:hypothetical protein BT63DRAFT_425910 [Microthyrium microscopicum]